MKYTIEMFRYPVEVEVEAETRDEAIAKAKEMFNDKTNGASIYEMNVLDVELINHLKSIDIN